MRFLPDSRPHGRTPGSSKRLRRALLACCACGVLATAFPWTYIAASRLFDEFSGPIAARTNPGFTCVTTCLLTALLVLAEGRSRPAREAVRTACVVLMGAACFVMFAHLVAGPATLRGVEAERSAWFFAAASAVALGFATSRGRMPRREGVSGDVL